MSPDTRYAIMRLMKATEPDADGAVNALLATSFVYRDPFRSRRPAPINSEPGGKVWDEHAVPDARETRLAACAELHNIG